MSLLKKFLGKDTPPSSSRAPLDASDSGDGVDSDYGPAARSTKRRELIQVVLRDAMRRHAVPSDWIECRALSMPTTAGGEGLHVQLVVRQGHERLLTFVPAFQGSFLTGIEGIDPHSATWLLSLSWEFANIHNLVTQESMSANSGPMGLAAAAPKPATSAGSEVEGDDDVSQDLRALFAIRDAALKPTEGGDDAFAPTQPPRA